MLRLSICLQLIRMMQKMDTPPTCIVREQTNIPAMAENTQFKGKMFSAMNVANNF